MARIVWSPIARSDYERILTRIAREADLATAIRWAGKFRISIQALEDFPEIGAPVEDTAFTNLRERLVGRYRIIYRFDGTICKLHYIVAAERDLGRVLSPEDLL